MSAPRSSPGRRVSASAGLFLACSCLAPLALAAPDPDPSFQGDLTQLSFEQLANLKITSVSRRTESLSAAAASVYVITAEQIRRSGATTLPEILRLAPNLHVASVSATGYAISARGMNGSASSAPNKLLVMVDGRSIYTPLFSGVFWDAQEVMVEDIERIEVISGPGGTLWGVNAVNGVISVTTRHASDSEGNLLSVGGGNHESRAAFRHGGSVGEEGSYRVHATGRRHDNTRTQAGTAIDDAGRMAQAGFRVDLPRWGGELSLQGNVYDGHHGQAEPGLITIDGYDLALDDVDFRGHNLLARWQGQTARGDTLTLQYYFDHTERTVPPTFAEELSIHDLQLQQVFTPIGRHTLAWGLDYRHSVDRLVNSEVIAFLPAREQQKWVSVHVQDNIELGERSTLTAGVRLEHNDYTGTEVLPNLRWAWTAGDDQLVWAAASRAVRAPSRLDADAYVPGVPPYLLDGGPRVRAEVADVLELGWRRRVGETVTVSATAFHTRYDDLRTQEIDPSFTFLVFDSQMEGEVTGLELWSTWQVRPSWRLHGGLVVQDTQLRLKPGSNDAGATAAAGIDPSNHWQLRSSWTLAERHDLDLALRHVGRLERWDIPAYTTLDLRYGWRLSPGLELSVSAQNLLDDHGEYSAAVYRTHHEPRAFAQLRWEF